MSVVRTGQWVTGGVTDYGWYPGNVKRGVIRERVALGASTPYAALTQQLPAGARILHTCLKNPTAITPVAASSATATNTIILGLALVSTAPTSLLTNSATSNIALGPVQTAFNAAIPANSVTRGFAKFSVTTAGGLVATSAVDQTINNSTSAINLYLVPYASTVSTDANGVGRFYVPGTSTGTTQYMLNGTSSGGTMDVTVVFEQYVDNPDN